MKKYSIIITAVLIGLFMPLFEFYMEKTEIQTVSVSKSAAQRNNDDLNKLAEEAFYKGNYDSAENYYLEILDNSPFDLESRRNLAVIYNEEQLLKKENRILLEAAIISGNTFDFLELAVSFFKLNNNRAAVYLLDNKVLDNNLESEENIYRKYYYKFKAHLELGELNSAEKSLNIISEFDINADQIYLLKAELSKAEGDFSKAYEYYKASYNENRSQTFLFRKMAELLENADREKEAYYYWKRSQQYGVFSEKSQKKAAFYEDKYTELTAEEESAEREEVDPFSLRAKWKEFKPVTELLAAEHQPLMLRIGLQENNRHLLFQYSNNFSVIKDGQIIFRGSAKTNYLLEEASGQLIIRSEDSSQSLGSLNSEYEFYSSNQKSSFYVFNISYGQGYFWQNRSNRQYRGSMLIRGEKEDNSFTLINKVDLTAYLLSVVPSEIYSTWPKESLKSQAVAARSYTLSNLGRHSDDGYDLCSSVHCAVYRGIERENMRTNTAVLETYREAAVYDGSIIEAVFSSNSGGFTERSDQIWSADLPYLRGSNQMKNVDFSFPLKPLELKDWIKTSAESYSKDYGSSSYRWQLKLPAELIEFKTKISPIKSIKILERAEGGTITSLKVIGHDEEKVYNGAYIRNIMGGIKSSRFYFESYLDQNNNLEEIYLYGAGWGHNLGLDQSAAAGMAKSGWNYRRIIKHFYPGVEIKRYDD